jgi:Zn-dependent peptidase ImmA (M78 family)
MAARGRGREQAQLLRHELSHGTGYVDILNVIRELGIELYLRSFEDGLDGAYKRVTGRDFIFVNTSRRAPLRHRFTAAHELGHARLNSVADGGGVFESNVEDDQGDREEQEANSFAAHFLMDERGVREISASVPDPEARVAAVVNRFAVSPMAAAVHLAGLGLVPTVFKDQLLAAMRQRTDNARSLLQRHGKVLPEVPEFNEGMHLDPAFMQRAFELYEARRLTLDALGDLVQEPNGIRRLLDLNGIEDWEAAAADEELDDPDLQGLLAR